MIEKINEPCRPNPMDSHPQTVETLISLPWKLLLREILDERSPLLMKFLVGM